MAYERTPNCNCSICKTPLYRRPFQLEKQKAFYCSHECKGKAQQKLKPCPICGNLILSRLNKKTCSRACANKQKEGLRYKQLGRPIKDKVKDLETLRKRLIEKFGNKCMRCGYDKYPILNVHHIIERCEGGSDELSNLELICPNCHGEEHYLRRLKRKMEGC